MRRTARWLLLALLCRLALPASTHANDVPEDVRPFRVRPELELPLLGIGAVLWIASEAAKERLAPADCRWCRENRLDTGVQAGLRWDDGQPAHALSDWLMLAIVPLASAGGIFAVSYAETDVHHALTDVMVVSEALLLASTLTQITKFSVARMRPYAHARREQGDYVAGADDNLSFFSGHTSSTFALAVAAGTTATLRGYRLAPMLWAVGLPLAAFTGYLRIAADRHYFSDVMTGALVGSLAGVFVPWLHARGMSVSMSPRPPAMFSLTFVR